MRPTAGIRSLVVIACALALAGCAASPTTEVGQSSACASPIVQLTPETAEPGQPLIVTSTGWGPCNDTIDENSVPPWPSVALEWVQNGETTDLGTVEVTDGRIVASVNVPSNTVSGEASLRVVTPDPDYEQDFPVSVD